MADTLHPPYNITQPRLLNRWLDVNPQNGPLGRVRAYFNLTGFNIPVSWGGYSDIVGVYNYTSTNNFSIKNYASLVNDGSYTLCVMYTNSNNTVVRYRLIDGVGAIIYGAIPKYTGQSIKKFFRLEVWSTPVTANQTAQIQFITSVLGTQDYRFSLDIVLATPSALCTSQANISLMPVNPALSPTAIAQLELWISAETGNFDVVGNVITNWYDRSHNAKIFTQGTVGLRPTLNNIFFPVGNYVQFLGQSSLSAVFNVNNMCHIYILVAPNVGATNNHLIFSGSTHPNFAVFDGDGGGTGTFTASFDGPSFASARQGFPGQFGSGYYIIEVDTTNHLINVYDAVYNQFLSTGQSPVGGFNAILGTITLGADPSATAVGYNLFAVVGYSALQSAADKANTIKYLYSKINAGEFSLPMTFAPCTIPTLN